MSDHPAIPGLDFAEPIQVESPKEASWYQCFDWPDGTSTLGRWDYRGKADDYLGHEPFLDRTVLELGPASGFLTKEMEQRGASVTCIDLPDDEPWEAVPRSDIRPAGYLGERARGLPRLRSGWWYSQKKFEGSARIAYCGVRALGSLVGSVKFDVALIACVLQHFRHPVDVLYNTAALADTIIVTEPVIPRVEAAGMAEFLPARDNQVFDTWWLLSSALVEQLLQTAGFHRAKHSEQTYRRWALETDSEETDAFTDRVFYTSVFKRT